jgi:hypothetical protein
MLKQFLKSSVLIPAAITCLALVPACSSDTPSDDDDNGGNGGSGGGSGAMGGSGGGGTMCDPAGDVTIIPNETGWVDDEDGCVNMAMLGIQGAWYPYGDQYGAGPGDAKCIKVGNHPSTDCSRIDSPPPPPAMGFPNVNGAMVTSGQVAKVLPCVAGSPATTIPTSGCPANDYSNIWGAGIGFDLNADPAGADGSPGVKHTWDPAAHNVVGIAFTIAGLPVGGKLRVEFPMQLTDAECALDKPPIPPGSTTDSHSKGAPFWGAQSKGNAMFPNSPVVEGENKVFFDDMTATNGIESADKTFYTFDHTRLLGIQFHVPSNTTSTVDYSFTISNIRFLRNH